MTANLHEQERPPFALGLRPWQCYGR